MMHRLRNTLNAKFGKAPSDVFNLEDPPGFHVFVALAGSTGLPSGLVGNAVMCLQIRPLDPSYNAIFCFSFGGPKLAYKNKLGTTSWSEWYYIS